jgi:tetratricopeptide (TPR) repeat protein
MDPDFKLVVPARLVNPNSRRRDVELSGAELADLALKFYVLAAKAAPTRAEAWLDVGLALEAKARVWSSCKGSEKSPAATRASLLSQAVKVYNHALKLDPMAPALWNNLGVLLCQSDVQIDSTIHKGDLLVSNNMLPKGVATTDYRSRIYVRLTVLLCERQLLIFDQRSSKTKSL